MNPQTACHWLAKWELFLVSAMYMVLRVQAGSQSKATNPQYPVE
jgi:hypothetical protein